MVTLWETDRPVNQNEIVKSILKDKPTISRMIQRLVKNGWITKTNSEYDGRVTIIKLTEKGILYKKKYLKSLKNILEIN